ncbi:hypothetical protein Tco_0429547 [Tanacetum coccineum]
MLEGPKLSRLTRDYATGEKAPKSKATKKKNDSEYLHKQSPSQLLKALSKQELMNVGKLRRSLKEFHISHASGSGSELKEESRTFSQGGGCREEDEEHDSDDNDDDNDDEDDDQENDSQRTESDDEGDDFVHPNLSTYIADDQEKEKEEEKADDDDDDDDDVTSDQKVSTPPDYELTEEDENKQDDDTMGEEQGDEDNGELYGDLNINLSRSDAEMTEMLNKSETQKLK